MASTQVTLSGGGPTTVTIPNPTGRIVLTLIGAAAEFWVTTDGSAPQQPANGVVLSNTQKTCAGVVGNQIVVQPQLYGNHMVAPTLLLASAGSPVVELEW